MNREYIRKKVQRMKTRQDLLDLLNEVKKDDLGDRGYPFTMKQINFYCNPVSIPNSKRYHDFFIAKKSGGKRQISAPVNGLKSIQTYLNMILQAVYEPSQHTMGFVQERSIVDNARPHIAQNYVFNLDLKDFFPSISQARVWGRIQARPFSFRKEIANVVAGLCCMKVVTEVSEKYILPQGAPTSPLLTNAICDKLDYKLSKLAKHYGLNYTRYADDITFSSMHNVYQKGSDFLKELYLIIQDQGFTINEDKTRLQKKGSRQEVTGLVVCDKVNVTKKYTEDIRNILYIWKKYGMVTASYRFFQHYKKEKGHVKNENALMDNVIAGKLDYLKMVKGEDDSTYLKLRSSYDYLVSNTIHKQDVSTVYLDSQSVDNFERLLNTKVEIAYSKKGNIYVCFMLNGQKTMVSVSNSITEIKKDRLQISWCENAKKERYFLLHWPLGKDSINKIQVPHSDELDITLAKLCDSNFDLSVL